jgi:hypothetical protein
MKYLSRVSNIGKALCLSFLLLTTINIPSFSQAGPLAAWTNVGSVGTVDEADNGKVGFFGPQVYLNAGFNSAMMRYNVTGTDGLFVGPNKKLTARFYKPNPDTQVIVSLFEHDLNTGAIAVLAVLNSNAFAPSAAFQVQSAVIGGGGFNFARKSYYIEVRLIRNAAGGGGGDPRLSMLQIITS